MTGFDDEETRARAYRASVQRRRAFRRQQEAALAGSPAARAASASRWVGLLQWLAERRQGQPMPNDESEVW